MAQGEQYYHHCEQDLSPYVNTVIVRLLTVTVIVHPNLLGLLSIVMKLAA